VNIAVYFIKARSNLILNCSFDSLYIHYSVERGKQGIEKRERERGEGSLN